MREVNDIVGSDRWAESELQPTPGEYSLAACVLLAGGLKASPLTAATGASPLDLHLFGRSTVLELWLQHCDALSRASGRPLDVRVIYGQANLPPSAPHAVPAHLRFSMQADHRQYRGPAGTVHDAVADLAPDATIMIAEGARFIAADLRQVVAQHHARAAEITVVCNADSTPAGIFFARRSTLDLVPRIGFMDLKEQWLTRAVATDRHVRVHRLAGNSSYELRTPAQFLAAANAARASIEASPEDLSDPSGRNGAEIAPGALVVDSVIMPGAVVGERCVVVRSIVCAGAHLEPGTMVVDGVVNRSQRESRRIPGRGASHN